MLLSTSNPTIANKRVTNQWQGFVIESHHDFNTFKLDNGEIVRLGEVIMPNYYQPAHETRCLHRAIERFYLIHLVGKKVYVRGLKQDFWFKRNIKNVQIRISDTKDDLSELLINRGWAKVAQTTVNSELTKMQKLSIINRIGRWGQCDTHYHLRFGGPDTPPPLPQSTRRQIERNWNIQLSRVLDISPELDIQLSNGLKVRLLGLEFPETTTSQQLSQCFLNEVHSALTKKIKFRSVLVLRDPVYERIDAHLHRHIIIPSNQYEAEVNIAQWLLENGYAQFTNTIDIDPELHSKFTAAEKVGLTIPKGAYKDCLIEFWKPPLADTDSDTKSKGTQEVIKPILIYDEACPIKGNISGTKKAPIKKYHTPLSGWYKRLKPEECFVDESEAKAAGFSKVK